MYPLSFLSPVFFLRKLISRSESRKGSNNFSNVGEVIEPHFQLTCRQVM